MANVDFSCPFIILFSFDYTPLRSNHFVCIAVVSYDNVTIFIRLVLLEQYYERYCRVTDSFGQRDGFEFASTTCL